MADIIKELLKMLPAEKISDATFEAANIVLYTKDRDFFLDNNGLIRQLVGEFKKRIELRPDPKITTDKDAAEAIIRKIIPAEAGLGEVIFDEQRSIVVISAEKPGIAIGKQGSILGDIRAQTFWVPIVQRTPAIRSLLIENIRAALFQHSDYRRKFLDKVGHRIYDGWRREKKNEWVRLTYLGSGRQVGRSCMFLQTPESRVLMDCGINVAAEGSEMFPYLDAPEFNIQDLDAVILSHAHLDHCGFLPYLFKMGYRGPVYCTEPTRDIAALLLLDLVKIAKNEGKDPWFDTDDIKEFVKHTVILDFEEVSDITPDIRITLYNSGHILGSAMVHLHIGNGLHNLVYGADMKFGYSPLLDAATCHFPRVETLMMESTYGGRMNVLPSPREQDEFLKGVIKDTIARSGKVLMPVLGCGRAQDVLIILESMFRNGELENIPIYIDGMVWDVTAIHTAYPEYLNSNIRRLVFHKDQNPFLCDKFKRVGSQKERLQVLEETGPCVILATSGMLVGGPSVEYLRFLADNPKNSLVFSCYQGEGSLGYRLQHGEKELIFKNGSQTEVTPVKMEVHRMEISDHSDRRQLMNFVFKVDPKPKKILVNHGEVSRCLDLASSIYKQHRIETDAPKNLETVRVR